MKRLLAFLLFSGFCSITLAEETSVPESILRIGILEKVAAFNLGSEADYEAVDLNSGQKRVFNHQDSVDVEPVASGTRIGSYLFGALIRISPAGEGKYVKINGKRYRDSILIRRVSETRLTVINELGLDGYVYGILPREVSPGWPMESLKAQAIVSRTFALNNLQRHNSEGFQLCSRVHCQVYGGLDAEAPSTNAAVDATHNQVLLYDGDLANTVFFANCGGYTESASNAWETSGSPPYLKPVRCKYCHKQSHYSWEAKIPQSEIQNALEKAGIKIKLPVRAIQTSKIGKSGRPKFVKISHKGGNLALRAGRFRMIVGTERIRSTLFTQIKKSKDSFLFKGRGWGHGVGLCQEGAKGMAQSEFSYKRILKLYYPGTKIQTFED